MQGTKAADIGSCRRTGGLCGTQIVGTYGGSGRLLQRRVVEQLPEVLLGRLDLSCDEFPRFQLLKVGIQHGCTMRFERPPFFQAVDMGL